MRSVSTRVVPLTGLVVALVIAGIVSHYASASPDGLNRVAGDLGFASSDQASGGGPLAGYEVAGIDHSRLSGGLAGFLGCLLVLGLSSLLFRLRRSPARARVRHHPRHRGQ